MKTKKKYEKPSMQVVKLQHSLHILQTSGGGVDPLSPFTPGGSPIPAP